MSRQSKQVKQPSKDEEEGSSSEDSSTPDQAAAQPAPPDNVTCVLIAAVFGAAASSFIFGYNIGVINTAGDKIKRWVAESRHYYPVDASVVNRSAAAFTGWDDSRYLERLSDGERRSVTAIWSLVGSLFPLGAMLGGLAVGCFADRLGRRGAMLFNNVLAVAAGFTMLVSRTVNRHEVLLAGRFVIGLNCGLNSGLAPMYMTEVSSVARRGFFGSINQLTVTVAILVANVVGLECVLGTTRHWPILLALTMAPCVWQLATLPFCPESPQFLLWRRKDAAGARSALQRLRGREDVEAELKLMQDEARRSAEAPAVGLCDMFSSSLLRWATCLCVALMLAQQLSGINATMFYSTIIFQTDAKLTPAQSQGASIGVMVVNVLMTVVATALVDRAGRRTLMIGSLGGMLVSTVALVGTLFMSERKMDAGPYLSIAFVVSFVMSFAIGAGPIPWFYVNECFQQNARGYANSIAVGTNWFAAALVSFLFPHVQQQLGKFTFLVFSACLLVALIFFYWYLPESRGKTVEQLVEEMRRGSADERQKKTKA